MLLPNGNNKKYIKTVIGVYILFTIISPILGKITNFDLKEIDYENYFKNTDTYQAMSENLTSKNDESVEQIYITNLKQDMTQKLKEKGYLAQKIAIKLNLEEGDNYGRLNSIYLIASAIEDTKEEQEDNTISNKVEISKVEKVSIGNKITNIQTQETKKSALSNSQKKEIKKYLASVYEVKEKNITVNQEE